MFNFSKSRETPTLNNKTDVQYKVICDWLRAIKKSTDQNNRRLETIILDISKLYDLLLKDDSLPDFVEEENDDSSTSRSVS